MPTGGADILLATGIASTAAEATAIAGTIGGVLETAGIGAGIGGVVGGIENGGKGILKGAEAGGLTGLGSGIGGAAIGGFGGAALGGAAGGALGAEATGGNPLIGAAQGGVGAGLSSAVGGNTNLFGNAGPATGTPITGGTTGGGGAPAPSGLGSSSGDVTAGTDVSTNPNTFGAVDKAAGAANSGSLAPDSLGGPGAAAPSNVSQNASTPSANTGSTASPSAGTDSLVKGFANEQAASDNLSPSVIKASNAASPGGTDVSLNQPGFLANATGSASPVAQGTTGVSTAAGGVSAPNTISTAFNNPTFSNIASAVGANAAPLAAGGGLVADALMNKKALPGQKELSDEAGSLAAQGKSLQQYLQTGTLPPGLQGAFDEASNQAVAAIRSQYAAHGMSGSSAEEDAISQVHQNVAAQGAQMALQLLQTGVSESEGAAQLYQSIMTNALSQDENLGSAIGRFATSMSGGTPGLNVTKGANGALTIGG